jgi:polyhydroxyalkanoate synthesis regulator phasin
MNPLRVIILLFLAIAVLADLQQRQKLQTAEETINDRHSVQGKRTHSTKSLFQIAKEWAGMTSVKASEAKDNIVEKAEVAVDSVKGVGENIKDSVIPSKDTITPATTSKSSLSSPMTSQDESPTDQGGVGRRLMDYFRGNKRQAKAKANNAANRAADKAANLANDASARVSGLANEAANQASGMANQASGMANQAANKANDLYEQGKLKAQEFADSGKEKAQELSNRAGEKAQELSNRGKETMNQATNVVSEKAQRFVDAAKEKANDLSNKASSPGGIRQDAVPPIQRRL